ncbi:MAG: serine hydrolase domain-containing protein [Planctomycetota bacterium]
MTLILALWMAVAPTAGKSGRGPIRQEAAQAKGAVQRTLAHQVRAGRLHGATLLAEKGTIIASAISGIPRIGDDEVIYLDTRFQIASLTKLFTQLAMLRLVDQDRLDLDAPIGAYRPSLPAALHSLTTRQLLRNRSGLPRELDGEMLGVGLDASGRGGPFLDSIDVALSFEPGTKEQYSNVGYWVAGAVVEAITELPWASAVQRLVIDPAGLENTGTGAGGPGRASWTIGHVEAESELRPAMQVEYARRLSSGGMYSTANDLLRLFEALREQSLLSSEASREFRTSFDDSRSPDREQLFAGGLPGHASMLVWDLANGRCVISLNNLALDYGDFQRTVATLAESLRTGRELKPATATSGFDYSVLSLGQELPDTPLGRAVERWLTAVGGEDVDALRKVLPEVYGAAPEDLEKEIAQLGGLRRRLGGFERFGYRVQDDGQLLVVVRGSGSREIRFRFSAHEARPSVIDNIDIRLTNIGRK